MVSATLRLIVLAIPWLMASIPLMAQEAPPFHTAPDKWTESRLFHTPFEISYEERIALRLVQLDTAEGLLLSPNKAYWANVVPPGACQQSGFEATCSLDARNISVVIFNERDSLLSLEVRDRYPNFAFTIRWVNEKLLFVRVWWGRVLGTDLLIDVEEQQIVDREMVNDGAIPFMQHQGRR